MKNQFPLIWKKYNLKICYKNYDKTNLQKNFRVYWDFRIWMIMAGRKYYWKLVADSLWDHLMMIQLLVEIIDVHVGIMYSRLAISSSWEKFRHICCNGVRFRMRRYQRGIRILPWQLQRKIRLLYNSNNTDHNFLLAYIVFTLVVRLVQIFSIIICINLILINYYYSYYYDKWFIHIN